MSERGSAGTRERDQLSEIIFMFSGFTFSTGAHSIFEEVAWFYSLWFPRGKFFVSLVIIYVHVILSNKILRSYCLNDKKQGGKELQDVP